MSKIITEAMLDSAKEAIKNNLVHCNQIESKYYAALASVWPTILSSGVRATMLFYQGKDDEKMKAIIKMIEEVINSYKGDSKPLYDREQKYIQSAIKALRLQINTFEKIDNIEEN